MPNVQLLVWNSQGGKWDAFWTHYFGPVVAGGQDAMGLLVEAGWAPWVLPGTVFEDFVYPRSSTMTNFNTVGDTNSAFCQGVAAARRRSAFWVPWVKNVGGLNVNSRCSMGAVIAPVTRTLGTVDRFIPPDLDLYLRSVFRFSLNKPTGRGGLPDLSVFLVHLISGYPNFARRQMANLINSMGKLIPEGTGAIIVGDFNIDIFGVAAPFVLPNGWNLLRTGVATQQTGPGELDYALLYDPNNRYGGAAAAVVQQYKTGNNQSDHSVMRYTIPLT